jgi:hypothetical protein
MINKLLKFIERNTDKIILIVAILFSVASFIYYYNQGLITAYGDSRTHLNIARRVFDNITPGIAQLGGVWMPLLHILMFPFIKNDFMWHSGLAGSLVSMPMYILSVYFVYKTILLITKNIFSGLLGALTMILNINFLYLQSTAMTESLFVATLTGSVYFLTKWAHDYKIHSLIFAATFFLLSSINRYEGWPVVMGASIIVFVISLKKYKWTRAEGKFILFSSLAYLGILMWLIWQAAIFHNPLYFLMSEFSAKAQTKIAIEQGLVPQYGDFKVSLLTYFYSLVGIIGLQIVLTGLIGLILYIFNHIRAIKQDIFFQKLPIYVLFIPGIFLIYALYNGSIPMSPPEIMVNGKAGTYFNIRYALYSLPALSVFLSIISLKKHIQFLILFIVISGSLFLIKDGFLNTATMKDTKNNIVFGSWDTQRWIKQNYQGGYILASAATSDQIIFGTGLNIRNFITEGNEKYWEESMVSPDKYAKWVILAHDERDMIRRHIDISAFTSKFSLILSSGIFEIYKKNDL